MGLALYFLGPFQVMVEGEAVTRFGYDKVRALLAYLAVETGRAVPREQIAALLWQDQTPEAARHSISQALLKLRRALRDAPTEASHIEAERSTIQFSLREGDWLDTRALTDWLDACEHHPHAALNDCAECIERMKRAVAVYRGDFLEGLLIGDSAAFEDWVVMRREQFRQRVLSALDTLTHHYTGRGQYDTAEEYARRLLELEPYAEEGHQALMQILARNGKRSAALAQYENCRRILAQELGVPPSAETTALYERLRAAGEARPHNLPLPLPALIGRERELAQIAERLADNECRLLNLVGPGGIGKTTLALAAAQAQLGAFLDGVWFVPLAAVTNTEQLLGAIAETLAVKPNEEQERTAQLLEHLRGKTMLLVLDNFEQLTGAQEFLSELLRSAPHVKLVLTSRVALELRAEWQVRVEGLTYPSDESPVQTVREFQAVRLFMERARRVSAGFAPNAQEELQIARICRLLWGSPLGIELAAGWTDAWSCRAIADEIETNLDFLATDAQDVPARHHSLRRVFEQSWAHLNENERMTLCKLAVFQLPFRRHTAQQVAGVTVYQLAGLAHKSFLIPDSEERYALHPLLKQFLTEKLDAQSEVQHELRDRHAAYFAEWVTGWNRRLKQFGQEYSVTEMRGTYVELAAALQWAAARRNGRVMARMGTELYNFMAAVGRYEEGIALFGRAAQTLQAHGELTREETSVLARQYGFGGALEMLVGAYDDAREHLGQSLKLARAINDVEQIAFCVHSGARLEFAFGNVSGARDLVQQGLELHMQLGETEQVNYARFMLGNIALEAGRLAEAFAMYAEGMAGVRQDGATDGLGLAIPLNGLGVVAYRRGDPPLAYQHLKESLRLSRALGHAWSTAEVLKDLTHLAADEGNYTYADALVQESLGFYERIGKRGEAGHALRALGWLAECQNDLAKAQTAYQESHTRLERARQRISAPLSLADLGRILARRGETAQARVLLERALAVFRKNDFGYGLAIAQTGLGIAAWAQMDLERAEQCFVNALHAAAETEEVYEGVKAMFELAQLDEHMGRGARAAALYAYVSVHRATPHHMQRVAAERYHVLAARGNKMSATDAHGQDFKTMVERVLAVA